MRNAAILLKLLVLFIALILCAHVGKAQAGNNQQVPFLNPSQHEQQKSSFNAGANNTSFRVAIIGAGPAGSSAAYHLRKLVEAYNTDNGSNKSIQLNMTIFEQDRIGGRARTEMFLNNSPGLNFSVNLGASIFLKENQILYNATQEFGLKLTSAPASDSIGVEDAANHPPFGIWNGRDWIFKASTSPWETALRAIWRWGFSAQKITKQLAHKAAVDFASIYDMIRNGEYIPVTEKLLARLGLYHLRQTSALTYFAEAKVNEKFVTEVIQAAMRVNYGTNIDEEINALGPLICMEAANEEAFSVEGGNHLIFEHMVGKSRAEVRKMFVWGLYPAWRPDGYKFQLQPADGRVEEFDAVISSTSLPGSETGHRPIYTQTTTTFILGTLNYAYFKAEKLADMPLETLTVPGEEEIFRSMTILRIFDDGRVVVKVFSGDLGVFSELAFKQVDDIYSYGWASAYPRLSRNAKLTDFELISGCIVTDKMEVAFSSMESQAAVGALAANGIFNYLIAK